MKYIIVRVSIWDLAHFTCVVLIKDTQYIVSIVDHRQSYPEHIIKLWFQLDL